MSYKGKYRITRPDKYAGDATNVVYRSLWERQTFKWCENNPEVKSWSSEETVIRYICKTDNKQHRYYIDLKIEFTNGEVILVEIKPKKYVSAPTKPKRRTKRYLGECFQFAKNISKWSAATQFAKNQGWSFEIWTEDTLTDLGIKLTKR